MIRESSEARWFVNRQKEKAAKMPDLATAPPVTERGARTRERILVAAREVFEELGFPDTRVAHIARRARVAYGSFYTYFPSKEAVFFELADQLFTEMTGSHTRRAAKLSPAQHVRRANREYYDAYRRNARMMAIVEQVATINTEFAARRRQHRALFVDQLAGTILRWQRAGKVDKALHATTTARALAAMVDHSLYLWLVHGDPPGADERLLDTLDEITTRSLGLP